MEWKHPSYYRELERIRKEEEKKNKALTNDEQSDSIEKENKESISDCLE